MKWDNSYNGHQCSIVESGNNGVDTLHAICHTCGNEVATLTPDDYPKYRLAFHAAEKALQEHSEQVLTDS
jgi:hypothetical protein